MKTVVCRKCGHVVSKESAHKVVCIAWSWQKGQYRTIDWYCFADAPKFDLRVYTGATPRLYKVVERLEVDPHVVYVEVTL